MSTKAKSKRKTSKKTQSSAYATFDALGRDAKSDQYGGRVGRLRRGAAGIVGR